MMLFGLWMLVGACSELNQFSAFDTAMKISILRLKF